MLSRSLSSQQNQQTQQQQQHPPQQYQQQVQQLQQVQSIPNTTQSQQDNTLVPNGAPHIAGGAQLRDFVKAHPEVLNAITGRHGGNQQAIIAELTQMASAAQNTAMNQQAQGLRPMQYNLDPTQLTQNFMQQNQQQPQQMRGPSPQSQHQRLPSADQFQFQGMQGLQNTGTNAGQVDYKQLDAVSLLSFMKLPGLTSGHKGSSAPDRHGHASNGRQ